MHSVTLPRMHRSCGSTCYYFLPAELSFSLSFLMTACGAPRLPHLTKLHVPDWRPERSDGDSRYYAVEQTCNEASQQVVAAYSAQLVSLTVQIFSSASLKPWLRLVFTRCRHLGDLDITGTGVLQYEPVVELQTKSLFVDMSCRCLGSRRWCAVICR
jgi:hypothetical protein